MPHTVSASLLQSSPTRPRTARRPSLRTRQLRMAARRLQILAHAPPKTDLEPQSLARISHNVPSQPAPLRQSALRMEEAVSSLCLLQPPPTPPAVLAARLSAPRTPQHSFALWSAVSRISARLS